MNTRIKIIIAFASLSLTLGIMSNTYSRYVADTNSDFELSFAKWQLLVNNNDITANSSSNIVVTPVTIEDENIKTNTIAPTSKGYFDISIDPTNVDVSFDYNIKLDFVNEQIPDLLITTYSIIDSNYTIGDALTLNNIDNNSIKGTLLYDNSHGDYAFEPFTVRIYFEWYDGDDNAMNDEADTQVSYNNDSFQISANITFSQHI